MSVGPFARLRQIDRDRRRLLVTAAILLARSSLAIAVLPFRSAIRFGCVPVTRGSAAAQEDIVWAIEAVARRLPWRTLCIQKGIAGQRMLRNAGADAELHYGVRQAEQDGRLEAHVWVTVGAHSVIGGEEADGFAAVATYP